MQGSILFNGNIHFEVDFIRKFQERILSSSHEVPGVRDSRKVLLICAAWGEGEYREGHIKDALRDIGVPSVMAGGFEQNIQNLAAWHEWQELLRRRPEIAALYQESMETIQRVKRFYREKNASLIDLLRRHTGMVRERFGGTALAGILGYSVPAHHPGLHVFASEIADVGLATTIFDATASA